MINKSLVKERFKKSLDTYSENSFVQNQMAENLIKMANPIKKFDSILELGCGSGLLTQKLINNFEFETYDAVDIVDDCAKYINTISDRINFINKDIEEFSSDKKYNLIISNATFQWVEKLPDFLNKIYENLEENGMFIFSTFGVDNLKEIKQVTKEGLGYFSCEEMKNILQEYAPFSLREEIVKMSFPSAKEILKHLKLTGVNSLVQKQWTKSDMKKFEKDYNKISPNNELTYHPVYVAIIKI